MMKMTAEEIVEMYNKNPTRETMEQIAARNECSIQEIGEFLKNTAKEQEERKKPGRPKKVEEVIIPASILQFANTRIAQLTEVIKDTKQELAKMEQELSELKQYLKNIREKDE